MGLFTTVIHVFKTSQQDVVDSLKKELTSRGLSKFHRLHNINEVFSGNKNGVFYLITRPHGNWTTIIELNVNITDPFYLYELTTKLSSSLNTYTLSFHLHDGDVLYYNLDKSGNSLDGYNSDYQYFFDDPVPRTEMVSQRHNPKPFLALLPKYKKTDALDSILNEGYWTAFDSGDLDEDGVPNDDKYLIDEIDRFERIGKYLEIYSSEEYPFADWYGNQDKLDITSSYILYADR